MSKFKVIFECTKEKLNTLVSVTSDTIGIELQSATKIGEEEEITAPRNPTPRVPSPNGITHYQFIDEQLDEFKRNGKTHFETRDIERLFKKDKRNPSSASPALDKIKKDGRIKKEDPSNNRAGPWFIVK